MRRFVHFRTHAPQQKPLLDHLIGTDKQRGRERDAERLGGLEVDDQLELGRLHDRYTLARLAP
jgi:hypothetical protein